MSERIEIYDTTLRDGAQGQGVSFSPAGKIHLAKCLDEFGVDYIEGGYAASNPKDMAFFKDVKQAGLKHAKVAAFGSTRRANCPVAEDQGTQALLDADTEVCTIFGKSWLLHVHDVLRTDADENRAMIADTVRHLKENGRKVIYDAEHFFDGYKDNAVHALSTLVAAAEAGADVIVPCDTNGGTMPDEVAGILAEVMKAVDKPVGIHAHNDCELGVANSLRAVHAGAIHVQGTINGFGERCGNANLNAIVGNLLLKMGRDCLHGDSLAKLKEVSGLAYELANMRPNEDAAYTGANAFAHKAGMHVDGVRKNPKSFEHINPEIVGNERHVLISELSGASNIFLKAVEMGVDVDKSSPEVKEILKELERLESLGYEFEAAEASFKMLVQKVLKAHKPFFELKGFRVIDEKRAGDRSPLSEATVKIAVDGKTEMAVGEGHGPVDALNQALRKALSVFYPGHFDNVVLTDYRVRILDPEEATSAKTRVLIESSDGHQTWSTVGVSENILEASWEALVDSVEYKLFLEEQGESLMTELAKTYDPKNVEDRWYQWWEENGHFHRDVSDGGDPYCIVIPPPNVTGILHMGHALNNTIQDVLIRWKRMQGKNAIWVPGTDHAGIATQNVVEKSLKLEGKTRDDLGREAFVERVWEWKQEYGNTITRQLRKMGCACDWERERFTMDEGLSNAVLEVFMRLYEKDLIYRGNYIINWCPRCQTALSDDESAKKDVDGKFYHFRYPIKGGKKKDYIVIATTRPETLLGDTAVAVNPRDERYKDLKDKTVLLPLVGRELKVIEDDFVDREFGTGIVKVTPAHDPNDFDMGRRHELEEINVMHPDGTINENGGEYAGLDRFEARKRIVADLEALGLLEKIEEHKHAVGHCYRCHTVVEPRLSLQWFVKMKPLARPCIEAVKEGRIRFVPERWNKVYLEWMENIRDWCISRQIWWGHRIPIFYCDSCDETWAGKTKVSPCPKCGSTGRQDPDVLDTWFSSWLWPFSVFGWPEESEDLGFYYPTDTVVTASEILFFWIARMIMAGMEFMDDVPFTTVYIHGTVRDETNRKMSKSFKNSIDPLAVIEEYSADALRFTLTMLTATGQDVHLKVGLDDQGAAIQGAEREYKDFELGRNFCTKIWNAARFMRNISEHPPCDFADPVIDAERLSPDDQHLLQHLQRAISGSSGNLKKFRFNDYAKELYDFIWHKYCDWYLEYAKPHLYGDDEAAKEHVLKIMHHAFSTALRLLHPVMPFITEELWHAMGYGDEGSSILDQDWPKARDSESMAAWGVSAEVVEYVEAKQDLIRTGRTLKTDFGLNPGQKVKFIIKPAMEKYTGLLQGDAESIGLLLRAESVRIESEFDPEKAMPTALSRLGNIYMPIEDVIDVAEEVARLNEQLDKVNKFLSAVSKKLGNQGFISKAPEQVVEQQRERKKELLEEQKKIGKLIAALGESA